MSPRCGRPTQRRVPCTKGTEAASAPGWVSPACEWHLTEQEKALRDTARALAADLEPDCWSWSPPRTWEEIRADLEKAYDPDVVELLSRTKQGVIFDDFHRGRCAICGVAAGADVDDHCHETGTSRGRLCRSCNISEGRSDHPVYVKYRERNPASILGMRIPYTGFGWDAGIPAQPSIIATRE